MIEPGQDIQPHPSPVASVGRVLLLIAAILLVANLARFAGCVVDDTYISLRYARNLIEGHGLVFNPGERVEGYTNPSLVLLAALFMWLGIDPVTGLQLVLLTAAVATLLGTARLERLGSSREYSGDLPLSLILLAPLQAFAFWSVCPMEAMLFSALLVWALVLTVEEARAGKLRGAVLAFIALAFTRPEGLYVFAVATGTAGAIDLRRSGTRASLRRHGFNLLIFVAAVAPHLVWRRLYYGSWVPNTFTAKTTWSWSQLSTGLTGLGDWAVAFPLLFAGLFAPLLFARSPMQLRHVGGMARPLVSAMAAAWIAYAVAIGGDFMPFFRFFVPVMPLCAVLVAWAGRPWLARLSPAAAGALAIVFFVLHVTVSMVTSQTYRALVAHRTTVVGEAVGKWLNQRLESGDLLAVNTAGALPYRARRPTLDMLGLTDPVVARRPVYVITRGWSSHRRGWGAHVLSRQPQVILFYNSAGARSPHYLSDRELSDLPLFRFFYDFRAVTLPPLGELNEPARPLSWVQGHPFGEVGRGSSAMPDLGLRVTTHARPLPWTGLRQGPILVQFFEFHRPDRELWPPGGSLDGSVDDLVARAAAVWRGRSKSELAPDPRSAARVDALCAEVRGLVEDGDLELARQRLDQALELNRTVRSALVPHYVANVATLSGDLWTAVAAQKEALRLAPDNPLYRSNLTALLTVPYERFSAGETIKARDPF